jgi:hypothetical protein
MSCKDNKVFLLVQQKVTALVKSGKYDEAKKLFEDLKRLSNPFENSCSAEYEHKIMAQLSEKIENVEKFHGGGESEPSEAPLSEVASAPSEVASAPSEIASEVPSEVPSPPTPPLSPSFSGGEKKKKTKKEKTKVKEESLEKSNDSSAESEKPKKERKKKMVKKQKRRHRRSVKKEKSEKKEKEEEIWTVVGDQTVQLCKIKKVRNKELCLTEEMELTWVDANQKTENHIPIITLGEPQQIVLHKSLIPCEPVQGLFEKLKSKGLTEYTSDAGHSYVISPCKINGELKACRLFSSSEEAKSKSEKVWTRKQIEKHLG